MLSGIATFGSPAHARVDTGEPSQYRLEIEGLRAIAVLSVITFHVGLALPGGYVGVDVFFVISGFLITRNILKDQESGVFSFKRFYTRRFYRLFPALCAVLLLTLAAGSALLAPDDMARLGRTALLSVLSLSNLQFWRETGYFDQAATLNPLLHSWSLSVEEQFYLVWPVMLVVASKVNRQRGAMALVIAIGVVSSISAELLRPFSPDAVFYLMPFRMYELCAGAVLALIRRRSLNPWQAEIGTALGVLAITYSAVYFDASTLRSPFLLFLPCIGTALVILSGNAKYTGKLLSNRAVNAVGTISYSLYLVHWPIIVFHRYFVGTAIPDRDQWLLLLLCFVVAALLYWAVELPFRSGRIDNMSSRTRRAFLALMVVSLSGLAAGAHAWYTDGWTFRVSSDLPSIPSANAMWAERNPAARVGSCFIFSQTRNDIDEDVCLKPDPGKPNYLIVGDSFAADAYVYLSRAFPNVNFLQATAGSCYPVIERNTEPVCDAMLKMVFEQFIPSTKLNGVVLSAAWGYDPTPLEHTIAALRGQVPRIVLIGPGVTFRGSASRLIFQSKYLTKVAVEKDAESHIANARVNELMRQRLPSTVDGYVDVQALMCEGHCRLFTPDNKAIYVDYGHLSLPGSQYLASKIAERYGNIFPVSPANVPATGVELGMRR